MRHCPRWKPSAGHVRASPERNEAAGTLAALKAERASLAAQVRRIETEAAPMRYVAELVGADADSERAIRWLIALMVLCCDPLAIALTAAASSAARTMRMRAPGLGRAAHGVGIANLDNMFVDMIFMHVMQMTVVQIIDMLVMAHSRVPTVGTMLMCVIRMMPLGAGGHGFAPALDI